MFLLLCLQLAIPLETKPKARIATAMSKSAIIGKAVDLTTTEIEYEIVAQARASNKVIVRTSPPTTEALIYMNVTNVCEFNHFNFCDQKNSENIISDMRVLLEHKGKGVYEGTYMIEENVEGKISLTFFIVNDKIGTLVYKDDNYDKG